MLIQISIFRQTGDGGELVGGLFQCYECHALMADPYHTTSAGFYWCGRCLESSKPKDF